MNAIYAWKHYPFQGIDLRTGQSIRAQKLESDTPWAWCIETIVQTLWFALLEEALREHSEELTIEFGDPNEESARAYFAAAEDYLKRKNIRYVSTQVPASHGVRARLYVSIPLR